uniref:lipid droplet assembly factor 1 isoform X1 n=1 Tax=Myodes glareolus TaxID=447135 RepID=UPI002020A710|nr:lipid droplet assembly factor 1 isoform X1 [Myodes glareolus]XP_048316339.1 lipid droplet assembly factor 1 isoform X1 [Myodes glareolus]XP_048316340.1 lipid droplet assembly factor 1 isoform X1 [Myodes glareolus]
MAKDEPPSVSRDLEALRRKLCLLLDSFQSNAKVVAFMTSPVGRYLDRHPFLALAMLMFVTMSAVPVGVFLLIVVLTSLGALMGAVLLEGLIISVCGLSLLCILCGLGFVALVMSGIAMISYVVVSCLMNYWFSPRDGDSPGLVQPQYGVTNIPSAFCLSSLPSLACGFASTRP